MTVPRQRPAGQLTAPSARPVEHNTAGRFLLRTLFWGGFALAVLPWWLGTKTGSIDTSADVFQAAGRVTGLIAGYLLLMQVILMSRLGRLERWIGARHLGLWHRELGGSVLVMILAHAALITIGYSYADSVGFTAELGTLLNEYSDMITAFIAAGMLVCIAPSVAGPCLSAATTLPTLPAIPPIDSTPAPISTLSTNERLLTVWRLR